ncbi:MAG: DUF3788 domain-containing protein [Rikenellaceae bacterium]|jgi:hypothetical protein|nr:DUF3788 domain-containing protein [Rikenellaceae bacterium]
MEKNPVPRPLLNDPAISPSAEVLNGVMRESYPAFEQLGAALTAPDFGAELIWKYYNDGKAWLCRVMRGKKTVCWLSAWDGWFKTSFFFTEKHVEGILALDIDEKIKQDFCAATATGKLLPLLIDVREPAQLNDILKIATFKKSLK